MKSQNLDEFLYSLPFLGIIFRRNYAYFKNHTATTNMIHVIFGLGLGFMIAGGELYLYGVLALVFGILGHVYAFITAK